MVQPFEHTIGQRLAVIAPEQPVFESYSVNCTPLGEDEVAGITLTALISAGTELALYKNPPFLPWIPGYAAVFRVTAVGSGVNDPMEPTSPDKTSNYGSLAAALQWLTDVGCGPKDSTRSFSFLRLNWRKSIGVLPSAAERRSPLSSTGGQRISGLATSSFIVKGESKLTL